MNNQTIIGIGCFAKPERLGRIFNKLVHDYALGIVEDNQFFDQDRPVRRESGDLLGALMAKFNKGRRSGRGKTLRFPEQQIITGFYLSLLDKKLNLKIFARGKGSRQKIYTAGLDELTKLRQARLN